MNLFGIVGTIFVVLKLLALINWSWWLVCLPFLLNLSIFVYILWWCK
jgi:hypothetical protein